MYVTYSMFLKLLCMHAMPHVGISTDQLIIKWYFIIASHSLGC